MEYLSEKDRERLKQVKQASEQQMKAKPVPQQSPSEAKPVPQQSPSEAKPVSQQSASSRFQLASPEDATHKWQTLLGGQLANAGSSDFKPFAKNPEKQKRYENFVKSLKQGERGKIFLDLFFPSPPPQLFFSTMHFILTMSSLPEFHSISPFTSFQDQCLQKSLLILSHVDFKRTAQLFSCQQVLVLGITFHTSVM